MGEKSSIIREHKHFTEMELRTSTANEKKMKNKKKKTHIE